MITIIIVLAVFGVILWAMVGTDIKESAGRTAESAGEYMDGQSPQRFKGEF